MDKELITKNEVENDGKTIHLYFNTEVGLYMAFGFSAFFASHIVDVITAFSEDLQMPVALMRKPDVEELRQYDSYTADIQNDSLRVSVYADAQVDIPQADSLSILRVKQHDLTDADIEPFKQFFFGDAPLYDGCIADCLYEFEKKYDGSLATGDYTVYDVNGDSIPELFIIYTLGDGGKHYELYFFNGERYEIGCASDDYLTVNSGAHDGLVFTQTPWNSQNYKVYYVSQGHVKLIYDMNKEYNDDGSVALTINGNEVSEAKWQEMTDSISTENMEYPDELSKVFAGFGR